MSSRRDNLVIRPSQSNMGQNAAQNRSEGQMPEYLDLNVGLSDQGHGSNAFSRPANYAIHYATSFPQLAPVPISSSAYLSMITKHQDYQYRPNHNERNGAVAQRSLHEVDAMPVDFSQLPLHQTPLLSIEAEQHPYDYVNNSQIPTYPPIPRFPITNQSESTVDSLGSMDVLSAERYNDGEPRRATPRRKRQDFGEVLYGGLVPGSKGYSKQESGLSGTGNGNDDASGRKKKRHKLSEAEEDERKSRGRPRLDTKDETAADRRRTQIRLAQRAYRNRKETTISELEKKVQDLRGTNEEMSNIFMSLYDFALKKGLVEREPEFAQHLHSTTAQFLALAASAGDDQVKDEEPSSDPPETVTSLVNQETALTHLQRDHQSSNQASAPPQASIWGYEFMPTDNGQNGQMDFNLQLPQINPHNDHLVVARATPDNASFLEYDPSLFSNDIQQWRVEVPETTEVFQQMPSIQESLPLPSSFSQSETTFARRLARHAAERAYKLLHMEHVAPRRFNEVFAFSLQFSTRESIASRIEQLLASPAKGSIYAWNQPFVHLGGAGTYYPNYEEASSGLMPKFRTGMSMGPFDAKVKSTRESCMVDDFRMSLPGFTREFFDSNDVESYLFNKGIDLTSNPDFISIDLEQLNLAGSEDTISTHAPMTPRDPVDSRLVGEGVMSLDTFIAEPDDSSKPIAFDRSMEFDFSNWTSHVQSENRKTTNARPTQFEIQEPAPVGPTEDANLGLSSGLDRTGGQRTVTLSVGLLVNELITEARCLGRATGFKATGVDAAVRRSLLKSMDRA